MGIPIVDVMVAEREGVQRNKELASVESYECVVVSRSRTRYAVMGARALRQQSADFEVWLKRALRHGDASPVETLHVSCISKSSHLLSTGLLNRRRSRFQPSPEKDCITIWITAQARNHNII